MCKKINSSSKFLAVAFSLFCSQIMLAATASNYPVISGHIKTGKSDNVEFATVYLKGTGYGCISDDNGDFEFKAPSGDYTLVVSAVGYEPVEQEISVNGKDQNINVEMKTTEVQLDEVLVSSTGVSRVQRSAYNTVALDTKELLNSTKNLSEALSKAPGLKLRESGGVGSDISLMLDGFSGNHVKIFIDGVPQEGVGASFSINNIPASYADHIEVYKGVVPVGFGTDAIGGVINIVTNKSKKGWFVDASYSYGSFNTHKSYINFGQTLENGFTYELNLFQNYSDNNYYVDVSVEDFETGRIDTSVKERVQRFNDTYHNEAAIAKLGVVGKKWADKMMFSFTFSNMYKEIQTGVRQDVVYGQKHRKSYSLMPSFEYEKRNLFTKGLDLSFTTNYNRNITTNVDTSSYKYNWLAETKLMNSPGEQSYQYLRSNNQNWNGTITLNYRIGNAHTFTLSHVLNYFKRSNTSLLVDPPVEDAIDKRLNKNITGLSYRLMLSEKWNVSVFGKYYNQWLSGPVATTSNAEEYVRNSRTTDAWGYGVAGTYFILPVLQAKVSYEKACRLPTIEEMFGDEDLEQGEFSLNPEKSDNVNFSLNYNQSFGKHSVYAEGGFVYRNTIDYIQRSITSLSGGKYAATYSNYGKVQTLGCNFSARYSFSNWVSVGGNFTYMNITDNMETSQGSTIKNINYGEKMPNIPWLFADSDVSFTWPGLGGKENSLTITYDNYYVHSFTYYSSNIGSNKSDYLVPDQLSHNISVTYSIKNGRYNFSFECKNFTDADLYDNFSLQKAGRAFYGKVRIYFASNK